ncbi:MAG: metallophosphoesterase, partial [Halieaceae bacterium]|nr:metallophosphoesterase [Halieaceae bacterium]
MSLGLLMGLLATAHASPSQQWRYEGVERVAVIPDVHGAYDALTDLLMAAGLVDAQLRWSGGATHVVSLGDLLDRGADSRKVMDLLMRLQDEAAQQGGRVHVVAGNHETMNLLGDLRYVAPGEYAAMGDLEPPGVREQAYNAFLEQRSEDAALSFLGGRVAANAESQRAFEEIYPSGYFGHRSAFSPQGVYGRWLLSLPAIVVINDTAFV